MIGNVHRSFNLLCIFLVLQRPVPVRTQVPPGSPVITGPEIIMMGETVTLTCTVNGGSPPPTVKWFVNDVVIDDTATTVGSTTLNSFTFTAVAKDHLKVFECQTENGVLQNPLSRTQFIRVHRTPNPPILTGPTTIVAGVLTKWTCRSEEGYPMQSMSMRLGNASFGRGFTSNSRLIGLKSYTVIGTLYWAPSTLNDKHMLYCDVYHKETLGANTPQTVGLLLSVKSNFTIKTPKDFYDPITGQSATLIVDVMSGKATKVSWYKNNYLIDASSNSRYSGGNYQTPSLTINRVELDDAGSYRASVTDGSDTKNTTITVSPKATPRQPTLTGPTSLTAGTTGSWTCISHGGFPLQTMSMRIGNKIFDSNDMSIYSQYEPAVMSFRVVGMLSWTPYKIHDGQMIYCDVNHPETSNNPQIVSLQLTVKTPLSVRAPTTTYHPEVTKEVTLTVDIKGNPTEIRWYKNNQLITDSDKYSGGTLSVPELTIRNVSVSDAGIYACEATDGKDTVRTSIIQLSVKFPLSVRATQTFYNTTETSTVTLNVVLSGTPTNIYWYKNNDLVVTSGRFSGGKISIPALTIRNVSMSDAGRYMFEATDGIVTVKTRPIFLSPITQLKVTAPKILYEPTVGKSITLYIDVTSSNIKEVRWYKNNKEIHINSDPRLSGGNLQTNSLTIKNVQLSDAGNYSSSVTDGFVIRNTSYIVVSPKATPAIPTLTGPTSLTAGTTGTWTCISVGSFPLQSLSMRIGDQVFNSNDLSTLTQYDSVHNSYTVIGILTWTPKLGHNGQQISCDVNHPETSISPQTVSLQLTVQSSLSAIATKVIYSQTESSTVTLDVTLKGTPTRVSWYHNDNLIILSGRFSGGTVSVPSLTIKNISSSDAGRYVFEATDGDTTVQTITILLSVRAILTVKVTKTLYEPVIGESIVLSVEVNSVNVTGVRWFKNNQEIYIASNSRLSGGNTRYPSLNIQNVMLRDAGNYISSLTDGIVTKNTSTIILAPNATPAIPTLTGPTSLTADTFGTWTCTSVGGVPLQTMSMRIGSQVFDANQLWINSQYDSDSMSFRVVGVLLWAPNIRDDGQTLYCDVTHTQTLSKSQTTSLRLTVTRPLLARASTVIYSPLETTTVILKVVLEGTPSIINWYKNGQLITISGKYSGGNVSFPALVIRNISINDAGSYVCEVTDGKTTIRTTTIQLTPIPTLSLTTPKTFVSKLEVKATMTFYNPKQSTSVTLRVKIDGTPTQVMWYQNGKLIVKSGRYAGGTVTVPSLTIYNVTRSDAGSYVCEVTNDSGTFRTATIQVSPTAAPEQPSLTGPTTVTEGVFGTWTCTSVGGVPLYKMAMRIDNQIFGSKHLLINSQFDQSSMSYRITGVLVWAPDISHDGKTLHCDILPPTNPIRRKRSSSQIASIRLTVKPALLVIAGKTFYNTRETESITLKVTIEGTPSQIRWYKNNQLITISNRYSGGNVSVPALTIKNVKLSDGGIFVCEVTNEKYTARSSEILLSPTPVLLVKAGKISYSPKESESVTLNVNVVGTPSQIRWYKNNQLITISNRYSGGSVSVPALTIKNVQLSDGGEYVCEITNGKDTARTSMIQVLPMSILSVVAGMTFYTPMETGAVTLNVNVVGTPSRIRWYKNKQLIKISNRYSGGNVSVPALTITNVQLNDGGEYVCEITNGKDTVRTSIIQLSPLSALSVVAGMTLYKPTETESVTLNVNVVGTPSQIRWYKNNQLITISNRYSGGSVAVPALTITNVQLNDGGEYVCEITNGKDTVRTSIIQLSPLSVISVLAGKTFYNPHETESVTLRVNVVGKPSHIRWYKNNQLITISNRYSGGNVSFPALTIPNVQLNDGGEYVCEITNGKDTARTSIIQLSPSSVLSVTARKTSYKRKETKSVTLKVNIVGIPSQIRWYKNNQLITISNRYSGGSVLVPALTITNLKLSDGGKYVCEVTNGKDTARTSIIQVSLSSMLSVIAGKTLYTPKETETVTLNVNVVGTPSHIRWYKNDKLITILNRYSGGDMFDAALTITNVKLSDGGEYVCEVTDGKDTARTDIIRLFPSSNLSVIAGKIFYNPKETESVTLNVNVVGIPSQIRWYKNNQLITILNRYSGGTVLVPALTITDVHLSDGGEYVCEVTNGKDTVQSSTIQLSPMSMLSVIAEKIYYNPRETESITLKVNVEGKLSQVRWYKNNQLITIMNRYSGGNVTSPALTITNVHLSDGGDYVCEVTNGKDTARSGTMQLSPASMLSVIAGKTFYNPKVTESVTLQVNIVGTPSQISWYKDNQLITISNRYSDGIVSAPALTITNVKLIDGGEYVCEITNGKDTARTSIIQLSPLSLLSVIALNTLYVPQEAKSVTLTVKIVGKPSQITWYKDNQTITLSDRYSGGNVSVPSLTIERVANSDIGDYVCEATDGTVTVKTKTINLSLKSNTDDFKIIPDILPSIQPSVQPPIQPVQPSIQPSVQPPTLITRAPTTTELQSKKLTTKFSVTTADLPKPDVTIAPQTKSPQPTTPQPKPSSHRTISKSRSGSSSFSAGSSSSQCHFHDGRPCCKQDYGPFINVDVNVRVDGNSLEDSSLDDSSLDDNNIDDSILGDSNCAACNNKGGKSKMAATTKQPSENKLSQTTKQPSDSKLFPTTKQPSDSKLFPTTKQPSNIKLIPTTKQPSDSKFFPTTKQLSDIKLIPTTKQPSNSKLTPTMKKPSDTKVSLTTKQPSDNKLIPTTKQLSNSKMSPTTKQPSNSKMSLTTKQPSESKLTPTTKQPYESKLTPTTKQPSERKLTPTTKQPSDSIPISGKLGGFLFNTKILEKRKRSAQTNDFSCYSCANLPYGKTCTTVNLCHSGHEHCMTQYNFQENGLISTTTRCSHMHICMNREENNADECYLDDKGNFEGSCTYCCSENQCNAVISSHKHDEDNDCENDDGNENCDKNRFTRSATEDKPISKPLIVALRNKTDKSSPRYKRRPKGKRSKQKSGDKSENQLSTNSVIKSSRKPEIKLTTLLPPIFTVSQTNQPAARPTQTSQLANDIQQTTPALLKKPKSQQNSRDISSKQKGKETSKNKSHGKPSKHKSGRKSSNPKSGGKPSKHKSGSKSSNPKSGGKPSKQKSGSKSSNPKSGGKPSKQKSGRKSSNPKSGGKPSRQKSGSKSSNPKSGGKPSKHKSGSKSSNPKSGSKPSKQKSGSKSSNPKSGGKPSKQKSGRKSSNPKSGGKPSRQKSGSKSSNPKSGGKPSKHKSGSKSSNPKSGGKPSKQKSGSKSSNPKSGGKPSKQKSGSKSSNPKSGGIPSKQKSGGKSSNPKSGGRSSNPKSGSRSSISNGKSSKQKPGGKSIKSDEKSSGKQSGGKSSPPASGGNSIKPTSFASNGHKSTSKLQQKSKEKGNKSSKPKSGSQLSDGKSSKQKSGSRSSGSNSGKRGGSSSWQGDSSSIEYHRHRPSCHFHKGRPCCKKHNRPAVDVNVHVHVDAGRNGLGPCPDCTNKHWKLGKRLKTTVTKSL